jgi:hypothetical protein
MKPDRTFEAESDLRSLIEAEKIKKDKARMAAAMKVHKDMMDAMKNIAGKDKGASE